MLQTDYLTGRTRKLQMSRIMKWFLICSAALLVALVAWVKSMKDETTPELTFNPDPSTARSLSSGLEKIPHIGTAEVLKKPQLRYCLSEDIRLQAASAHAQADNADHKRQLSQMRSDFQARCASFKYKVKGGNSDLDSVRSEVERQRNELYAAGRSRFVK